MPAPGSGSREDSEDWRQKHDFLGHFEGSSGQNGLIKQNRKRELPSTRAPLESTETDEKTAVYAMLRSTQLKRKRRDQAQYMMK